MSSHLYVLYIQATLILQIFRESFKGGFSVGKEPVQINSVYQMTTLDAHFTFPAVLPRFLFLFSYMRSLSLFSLQSSLHLLETEKNNEQ